ncbi:sugar phosphate isomerase/epimerase family protein [Phycisphaerales bacterium AB-hyl4]|uniref:Sugar phosphate isomerase/epimerase family protein n=1 Tax=Natronomicrosphaera hydrolytica TaxID=3242702 RepID=A0ABV4U3M7_9BACT
MSILTHGSDLTLSPAIGPLVRPRNITVRATLDQLARLNCHSIQLDATLPGLRPRELSVRARRDLLAMLNRRNVRPAGLDLFIPRKHYTDPDHVDRAMAATTAAIELAHHLGRLPVSLALPVKRLPDELRSALVEAADGHGVRLAIHAEDQLDHLETWLNDVDLPALGAAIDPAALLARGHDPAAIAQRLGKYLAVARLSDIDRSAADDDDDAGEAVRCPVGSGELDLIPYRVSLDLAVNRVGPVVLDPRGLPNPYAAFAAARHAWENAAFTA